MILMLLSLFVLSFTSFALYANTFYHGVDNTFTSINYSLPNLWVVTDIGGELDKPLYDTVLVEETVVNHLSNNLKRYIKHYQVGFYYFDSETLSESEERYVSGVRLSLRADIPFTSAYYKAMTYVIKGGQI